MKLFKSRSSSNLRLFLLLILMIMAISSFSVVGYLNDLFNEEESLNNSENKAIMLIASEGSLGFGHAALLLEQNNEWFYFSWQFSKVVFTKVPNSSLKSLDSFNNWIRENNSLQEYINGFDSAFLIEGNFSESIIFAEELFSNYYSTQELNSSTNYSSLESNEDYDFLFNNCIDLSFEVLSKGLKEHDYNYKKQVIEPSIIPNIAKHQLQTIGFQEFDFKY